MKQHNLPQGSAEWHAHRRQHFNASDAPAMLGCSPYQTRAQLLHKLHTGLSADVDAGTQRRFDDGHRFEELARPLAEEFIGEDLFPVVGTDGELSASFDGLTMDESTVFEHKSLNDELRACMPAADEFEPELPKHFRAQMEQQLIVSGAERVLFMASKWDGDTLIEERHCWYASDPALRAEILAGWKQFAQDLAAYRPVEVLPAAVAAPVESLPAVSVQVQGALSVVSNLPKFREALQAFIAKIPTKPSTDQEFADTDAACKALKKAEEALEAAEAGALGQISSVEEMTRMVGDLRNLARTTRLASQTLVEARKAAIRTEEVQRGKDALAAHITALNARLGKPYMPPVPADFATAIKGKKTLASVRDSIDVEIARAKIAASETADRIEANLRHLREHAADHAFLFADAAQLVLKAADDCAAVVSARIAEHQAAEAKRIEAERERIRVEEAAKLQREQEARDRETARLAAEAAKPALTPNPVPVAAPAVSMQAAAPNVVSIARPAPAAATPPTLKLGTIGERLGFTVTADFLARLGFTPVIDKSARLFHEQDFPRMCAALISHIQQVQRERVAA